MTVSLSLVYFTCMKKRTTMVALAVAISSAATGLNHPRSTWATKAVTIVRQIRIAQIAQYSLLGRMCSDIVSFLSVIPSGFSPEESAASFVPVNQVKQWEQINPHNVHEVPRQARPKSKVRTSRTTISFCLPNCAARTERATVKLLQIKTAVFMVPIGRLSVLLATANSL